MKGTGRGSACTLCSQDKQKCEGVQWVGAPASNETKLVAELAGLREDLRGYSAALIEVMGEIASNQHQLVARKFENAMSVEGTPSVACSVLGDNPLWWEFREWRREKYGVVDWREGVDGDAEADEEKKEDMKGNGEEDDEEDKGEKEDGEVVVVG